MSEASGTIQLCVATGQNIPNLIGALQVQSEEVWILETPGMHAANSGTNLRKALKSRGIKACLREFPEGSPREIWDAAVDLADDVDQDNRQPIINITGGTKLMTLALVQELANLLRGADSNRQPKLLYVDTSAQKLQWLGPNPGEEPMQSLLDINDVLRVQGYEHDTHEVTFAEHDKWLAIAEDRRELTEWMLGKCAGSRPHEFLPALSALQGVASKVVEAMDRAPVPTVLSQTGTLERPPDKTGTELLDRLNDAGILDVEAGQTLCFREYGAARYCAGTWLEEALALSVQRQAERFEASTVSWRANVTPRDRNGTDVKNEVDLMLVHANRVLIVECKAAKPREEKAGNWLSKLDELARRVAGSQASRLLVSAREPGNDVRERAALMGVDVCAGADLAKLGQMLCRWIDRGTFSRG